MASNRRSVLITGCSAGGIGAGLAEAFHDKGYHVFATARTPSKVSPSLAKSPNVTVIALDVLSPEAIAAAVEAVTTATGGKLDVLVNNSGTLMIMPALDVSIPEAKKIFDTNYWALLAMIQAFAPLLIKAQGCVVNNTSVSGVVPFGAFGSIYNSSKAAAILGSETWRLELAPLGVRTLTLVTAAVKSNVFGNINHAALPGNSYYRGVRDYYDELFDGKVQDDGITPKQLGAKVVRQVEKGATGKLWVGGGAAGARWAAWLLPDWAMVSKRGSVALWTTLANRFWIGHAHIVFVPLRQAVTRADQEQRVIEGVGRFDPPPWWKRLSLDEAFYKGKLSQHT